MKVLVIGSGGREHAIVKALIKNPRITKLYAAPGNGGIMQDAECIPIKADYVSEMVKFALQYNIDYAAVIPDNPLALGMVDALTEQGIRCFGPTKAAARIESSKVFAKDLMIKYGIPTAAYKTFSDPDKALEYIQSQDSFPQVIKADGLAFGKGVIVAENLAHANSAIKLIMRDKIFGESGATVLIEEFIQGPEVSVLALTDGKTIAPLVSSMDHKRVFDGNQGPNTGGMGTIAPNPHYSAEIAQICEQSIFLPTIRAMEREGCPFKGCLYFGLMLTDKGPQVIEYNCRFGDPETQVVLPLLETDLFDLMEAVTDGNLANVNIRSSNKSAACVILSSGGYPGSYTTDQLILGLDNKGSVADAFVFHAGTEFKDNAYYTSGGRVLGITATGPHLQDAVDKAYAAVNKVKFNAMHYRKDIGKY
jgi:phosphoribosylamine--glycine ligase